MSKVGIAAAQAQICLDTKWLWMELLEALHCFCEQNLLIQMMQLAVRSTAALTSRQAGLK